MKQLCQGSTKSAKKYPLLLLRVSWKQDFALCDIVLPTTVIWWWCNPHKLISKSRKVLHILVFILVLIVVLVLVYFYLHLCSTSTHTVLIFVFILLLVLIFVVVPIFVLLIVLVFVFVFVLIFIKTIWYLRYFMPRFLLPDPLGQEALQGQISFHSILKDGAGTPFCLGLIYFTSTFNPSLCSWLCIWLQRLRQGIAQNVLKYK